MSFTRILLLLLLNLSLIACSSEETTTATVLPEPQIASGDVTPEIEAQEPQGEGVFLASVKCDIPSATEKMLHLQLAKMQKGNIDYFYDDKTLVTGCDDSALIAAQDLPAGLYRINTWSMPGLTPQQLIKTLYFTIKPDTVTYLGQLQFKEEEGVYHFSISQTHYEHDLALMREHYDRYKPMPVRRVV